MPKMFSVSSSAMCPDACAGRLPSWKSSASSGAGALELEPVALEPHAAPEELDDLAAFLLADVHQAHRAKPPLLQPSVNFFAPASMSNVLPAYLDFLEQ